MDSNAQERRFWRFAASSSIAFVFCFSAQSSHMTDRFSFLPETTSSGIVIASKQMAHECISSVVIYLLPIPFALNFSLWQCNGSNPIQPTNDELASHVSLVCLAPCLHLAKFGIEVDVRVVPLEVCKPFGIDLFLLAFLSWLFNLVNIFCVTVT